jgi:hypothetical protein
MNKLLEDLDTNEGMEIENPEQVRDVDVDAISFKVDHLVDNVILFKRECRKELIKRGHYLPRPRSKACTAKYYLGIMKGDIKVLSRGQENACHKVGGKISKGILFMMLTRKTKRHGFDLKHLPDKAYLIDMLYAYDNQNYIFRENIQLRTGLPKRLASYLNIGSTQLGWSKYSEIFTNPTNNKSHEEYEKFTTGLSLIIDGKQHLKRAQLLIQAGLERLKDLVDINSDFDDNLNRYLELLEGKGINFNNLE